jgi:tripartite-type tricarboxylate transporter receptor subunit TctC
MAPAGTPSALIDKIQMEVRKALTHPDVRAKLEAQGATVVGGTPAETVAFHRGEMAKFKRAVEISGAKID